MKIVTISNLTLGIYFNVSILRVPSASLGKIVSQQCQFFAVFEGICVLSLEELETKLSMWFIILD